jgi:uncharacterized protein (TIGR03083 family)
MQLTPRYDDAAFLRVDLPLGHPGGPLLRQRRRLIAVLGDLSDAQWATPSRCDGWSVRDVAAHLVSTNQFWAFSMGAALAGEPTRFLATFDPVASPAELVDSTRAQPPAEVLQQLASTTEELAAVVETVEDWSILGEAPPGHVPLRAVALHALWDGWVHERDIVLPLGLDPVEEPDEVLGCLAYSAALSPAFAVATGRGDRGAIAVAGTDPQIHLVVEVADGVVVHDGEAPADALHLSGPSVALLEALSRRGGHRLDAPEHQRWLLDGLATVFDQEI